MKLLFLLLQAAPAQQGGGMMSTIIMMVLIIVVFYFFMIRPQTQKQKKIEEERNALKKGDKVVTAGGIHGIIKEIDNTTMLIDVANGVRIRVDKASIYAAPDAEKANPSDKAEKNNEISDTDTETIKEPNK